MCSARVEFQIQIRKITCRRSRSPKYAEVRACLHGGGGPQVGEVTRLAVVEKWPAFTCKLTTPGSRGDFTWRCCVVARHVNIENGRRTTHFGGLALANVTWTRPRLGGLPHLEPFTWQNATPARRVTLPGRPGNPPRRVTLPHLSCKHDQIKMRDYMERRVTPPRRVTSPTWGPPPPCKQALTHFTLLFCRERLRNVQRFIMHVHSHCFAH